MVIGILFQTVGIIFIIGLLTIIRAFTSEKAFLFIFLVVFVIGVAGGTLYILK